MAHDKKTNVEILYRYVVKYGTFNLLKVKKSSFLKKRRYFLLS